MVQKKPNSPPLCGQILLCLRLQPAAIKEWQTDERITVALIRTTCKSAYSILKTDPSLDIFAAIRTHNSAEERS